MFESGATLLVAICRNLFATDLTLAILPANGEVQNVFRRERAGSP